MITREEALQTIHDCRITSLGELAHGYTVYESTANILINQLFNQQYQLQQHIKDLESQLSSNPLQLTCKDCSLKLLCEKAQKSKDTFGTKLYEQWFSCFEKDTK